MLILALALQLAAPDPLAPLPPPYAKYLPTVPGAINPAVTDATIRSTICVKNWTKTVRPPVAYTSKIKKKLMAVNHLPGKLADYELDHLLSLEDGGDPGYALGADGLPLNLWMQPYADPYGARTKDKLETLEKTLVCNGTIDLATAQHELQFDWIEAYTARIGPLP
jgi:hypothetical protein